MSDPTNVTDPGLVNVADQSSVDQPTPSVAPDSSNVVDPGLTNVADQGFGGVPSTPASPAPAGPTNVTEVENEAPVGKGLPVDVDVG